MTKYTHTFKQQVIDFYLEHHQNLSKTLRHFELKSTTVRRWIVQFNTSGSRGLAVYHAKQVYSPDFKLNVIQAVLEGEFTLREASLHFGIPNDGIISQWLNAFEKHGITGLYPKPKGRSSMKPKYAKRPPPPKTEEDRLRRRILELEAEVAYLKKLDEILRRDEAQRRKPSNTYAKPSH